MFFKKFFTSKNEFLDVNMIRVTYKFKDIDAVSHFMIFFVFSLNALKKFQTKITICCTVEGKNYKRINFNPQKLFTILQRKKF